VKRLVIYCHLGLGDAIICNAIVRDRASRYDRVVYFCKHHNHPSVKFMFRDLPNVWVVQASDDADAERFLSDRAKSEEVLRLGGTGDNFVGAEFDKSFYRQAGVPFEHRWDRWSVLRGSTELRAPCFTDTKYAFIHSDPARGFNVDPFKLPSRVECEWVEPNKTENIFEWWSIIENAEEIHVINSSFLHFIDSIPTKAKRHVLHKYARPQGEYPTLRKDWKILT